MPEIEPSTRAIGAQKRKMELAEQDYIKERSKFRKMVHDHLEQGGSPTDLGRTFDPPLTRGRIYQIRTAWVNEQRRNSD